jgi:hypothetical protein
VKIYEGALEADGKRLSACLIRLENASIVLLDEKENIRLGTLAAAVPEYEGKRIATSVLLGERNAVGTRVIAERVSANIGGIALVSMNAEPIADAASLHPFMSLTMELVEKAAREKKKP